MSTHHEHRAPTGADSRERTEAVREFFVAGDRFARHSGIELVEVAEGFARAKMTLAPFHLNGVGIAHGGALFTLADFAFAAASNSHGTVAVAISATISILKASQEGTLWAEAREVARSRKVGTYAVEVKDESGGLVALFQGTVYRKSEALPL
jgi:acyl-CoA thioesterase